ncbi:spore germination protein [Alteribacter keqinensis]|uniref:Spore germination protein n=1 Tax=Alteribacter keqinensis TaxID=2483800 RepID=A0A3M7TR42_9BACI|nr:spore germination protein [Alteribacter keqinensis]RNA67945.1 spore germination protein [Alteribacter keqinensis]
MIFFKKRKKTQPENKTNPTLPHENDHAVSEEKLRKAFKHCSDVVVEDYQFNEQPSSQVLLIYTKGLTNLELLNKTVIPTIETHLLNEKSLETYRKNSTFKRITGMNQVIDSAFNGDLILFEKNSGEVYTIEISQRPQRRPEQPNNEISVVGPRDGFIEELDINLALVRKRLKTTSLSCEMFVIGERSQTKVALLYMKDIARPQMIEHIRKSLEEIETDAILNSQQLEELLTESSFRLFPMYQNSGRPDYVCDALLRGRFVMFINGIPQAVVAPVTITLFLKTAEDAEYSWHYNSLERVLRIAGLSVATFLPGFWVALSAFHQDQVPFILLASVAETRQGVPLPTALEAFVLVSLFELFREAGLRLPLAIGQILAVVGGLIIGDAAINAGLTNPAMVVIVATSAVATFTLVSQALQGTITILRFFVLLSSAALGLFGFFISAFFILLYVSNLRSYSIPYMAPLGPFRAREWLSSILRIPRKIQTRRPAILHTDDDERQGKSQ